MRGLAFACLAATAASLTALRPTPASVLKTTLSRAQRASKIFSQLPAGWVAGFNQESGLNYYCDEQTGQCQWHPPQQSYSEDYGAQQGYGQQVIPRFVWSVVPTVNVHSQYSVSNGEQLVLGRFDMTIQNPYISEVQCLLKVEPNGAATLSTVGQASSAVRGPCGRWAKVRPDQTHLLHDGYEIALETKNPENAVFTVYCQQDGYY